MSEETQPLAPPEQEKRWALIIGANRALAAQDIRLHDELSAVDDAEKIANVLTGEHCRFEPFCPPMLGEQASSQNVKGTILRFGEDRTENDFLLLYFAGHGYVLGENDTYLVTHDFNEQEANAGMHLSLSWLLDFFYFRTRARKVLLILDCCNAGNILANPSLSERLDLFNQALKEALDLKTSDNNRRYQPDTLRYALTSTVYGQTAGEKNGHGMMTGYLLQALRGEVEQVIDTYKRGYVSLLDVYQYLQDAMRSSPQQPDLPGRPAGNECILAFYEEKAEEIRRRKLATVNEKPTTYIPWDRLASFQPRPGEFAAVTRLLFEEPQSSAYTRVVGLIGIGGTGKTQLAVELAYNYKDENRFPAGIFWLPITETSSAALQKQVAALCADADYLPAGDDVASPENERRRAQHLCRYLVHHPDALLILDNVEQIDPLLKELLPAIAGEGLRCTILYTSRRDDAPSYVRPYAVGGLDEVGAWRLLLSLERRQQALALLLAGDQNAESQAARAICEYVQRLPLAITLLCNLLQDDNLTLVHLWEEQQKRGTIDITRFGQDILKAKLFTTFEQSWEKVTFPNAQRLFKLAVHFPETLPISRRLLGQVSGLTGNTRLEPLGEALWELQRWGLVTVGDEGIRLHPLIREFGWLLVHDDPERAIWLADADNRLLSAFTAINHLQQRVLAQGYWACLSDVQEALNYARSRHMQQLSLLEQIEYWMARESYQLGDLTTWSKELPALFYQQFYNHFVEEGYPLPPERETSDRWIRQLNRVGTGDPILLRELRHPNEVTSVAFSPDNRSVLTGCADDTALLWEIASGRMLQTFEGHTASITRAVFSPDGKNIATGSLDDTARLWDVESGRTIRVFQGHEQGIQSIAFSPDGTKIATASEDRTARVWDIADGKMIFYFAQHLDTLLDIAFSPDGKQIVTCAADGYVFLWDIESEQVIATLLQDDRELEGVAFSPDGLFIAISDIEGVFLWSVERQTITQSFAQTYTDKEFHITQVCFSPDGQYLAAAAGKLSGKNNMAQIWKIASEELWSTYRQRDTITSIDFSPDGSKVATGSFDYTARIWNFSSQPMPEPTNTYDGEIITMLFTPDGRQLVVATRRGIVRLWDVQSEKRGESFIIPEVSDLDKDLWAPSIAIPHDGEEVAIAMLGNIWLWNREQDGAQQASAIDEIIVHWKFLLTASIAISSDEQVLMIGAYNKEAQVVNLATRQIITTLQGHQGDITAIVFSPDGSRIVTASTDSTAIIWDAKDYTRIATLRRHIGPVASICISPDSALVATGGLDGTIYLWSLRDGTRLSMLKRHDQRITSMCFSPDTSLLVSCDLSGQVFFWRVQRPVYPAFQGLYTSAHEIGAIHWRGPRHIILADTGGAENRPHFYHLALEGSW